MQIHGRAKLGPGGRLALCEAIESGMTFRQAAAAMSVSPATAHRWWHRYARVVPAERQSLAWAADRSSRPHRSPRLLDAGAQERICRHAGTPVGGLVWSRASLVIRTRRFGRSFTVTGCRGAHASRGRQPTATSGPALETCCTSTSRPTRALRSPGMRSPAIAHDPASTNASISARATPTQPSMTIPGWRSASSTRTSAPARCSPSSNTPSRSTEATGSRSDGSSPTTRGATPKTEHSPSCSTAKASSTRRSALTEHALTARLSASTRRWPASGATA
jgi:hypothetical protein